MGNKSINESIASKLKNKLLLYQESERHQAPAFSTADSTEINIISCSYVRCTQYKYNGPFVMLFLIFMPKGRFMT